MGVDSISHWNEGLVLLAEQWECSFFHLLGMTAHTHLVSLPFALHFIFWPSKKKSARLHDIHSFNSRLS
jgi:hypothetical protein